MQSKARIGAGVMLGAGARSRLGANVIVVPPRFHFEFVARRRGRVLWREEAHNLVVNEGLNSLLAVYFDAATQITSWFLGLKGSGSAAAGDTLASHGGWTEITAYTGNRAAITWGTVSGGSLAGGTSTFAITGAATIAGAIVASVNTGTSGVLYSAGDFGSPRSLDDGDELDVTPTVTSAAA